MKNPSSISATSELVFQHTSELRLKADHLFKRFGYNLDHRLYNRAMLDLQDAIKLSPALIPQAMRLFEEFRREGGYDKAVTVGLVLLRFDAKNAELMNLVGNIYRRMRQPERALKMFQAALKCNPKLLKARYNLAASGYSVTAEDEELVRQTRKVERFQFYRRHGFMGVGGAEVPEILNENFDTLNRGVLSELDNSALMSQAVVETCQSMLRLHPQRWEHHYDLGLIQDLLENPQEAYHHYLNALSLAPREEVVRNNLAVLLAESAREMNLCAIVGADQLWHENLKQNPNDRTSVLNLAIFYRNRQKTFSSLKYFTWLGQLLAQSHGLFTLEAIQLKAEECFHAEKFEEAISLYQTLIQEHDCAEWHYRLGLIHHQRRQLEERIECWKTAHRMDPTHSATREALEHIVAELEAEAEELIEDNFLTDAMELLEKAVRTHPRVNACTLLIDLYKKLDRPELIETIRLLIQKLKGREQGQKRVAEGVAA